jgi:hypothetical protein
MKVLFLDHDGVICLQKQWGTRFSKQDKYNLVKSIWGVSTDVAVKDMNLYDRFDNFDTECIDMLNQLILETDCQIVVSSDWRLLANVDEMGDYYESQGIIRRPIGFTYVASFEDLKYHSRTYEREEVRSHEILQWLSEHPEVTQWVAIDDLDMRKQVEDYSGKWDRDWGLTNFVWTNTFGEGIAEEGKLQETLKYLL